MQPGKLLAGSLILIAFTVAVLIVRHAPADSRPLWPGSQYTQRNRDEAVERGLVFIDHIASNPGYFARWGHDLLWCLYTISNTSKNEHLRAMARAMGEEHARQWRRDHAVLHFDDPDDLVNIVEGTYSADLLLGNHDETMQHAIEAAVAHYSAHDFMPFDPHREPPPADYPELCPKCNHQNPRGATRCEKCRTPLTLRSPYDVWLDALIRAHTGDRYGVQLGASYPDVVQWVAVMRPYPSAEQLRDDEDRFHDVTYAVTHVIYTLDDYGKYRLSADWLRPEFNYLRANLIEAEKLNDGEMLGEFLDTLRAFGRDESDPEIRAGVDYLLAHQNYDGSWGDIDSDDTYTRYHTTWTAIDGLREYRYQGERIPVDFSSARLKK